MNTRSYFLLAIASVCVAIVSLQFIQPAPAETNNKRVVSETHVIPGATSVFITTDELPTFPVTEYSKLDSAVGLDGKLTLTSALNNPYYLTDGGDEFVYFYVNLAAADFIPAQDPLPLNLSLVIDRSGSMSSENKLGNVLNAAKLIIDKLRPQDRVSVVVYDDKVGVEWASGPVTDKAKIKGRLSEIFPGGSTNLSGGMLEGYKQTKSTYSKDYLNRVILLSDGQANVGETDPHKLGNIAQDWYLEHNISISTFGVGLDYNEDLMTKLAEKGRGNYYFISNSNAVSGIFEKELSGLLATLVKNLEMKITFPSEYFEFVEMSGFAPVVEGNKITVRLHDLLSADSKTLLVKCRKIKTPTAPVKFTAAVSFTKAYDDKASSHLEVSSTLTPTTDKALYAAHHQKLVYQALVLLIANKNYEDATRLVDNREFDKAETILGENSKFLSDNIFYLKDSSLILLQLQNNTYAGSLDSIEEMSENDYKYMQKQNKVNVYDNNRK